MQKLYQMPVVVTLSNQDLRPLENTFFSPNTQTPPRFPECFCSTSDKFSTFIPVLKCDSTLLFLSEQSKSNKIQEKKLQRKQQYCKDGSHIGYWMLQFSVLLCLSPVSCRISELLRWPLFWHFFFVREFYFRPEKWNLNEGFKAMLGCCSEKFQFQQIQIFKKKSCPVSPQDNLLCHTSPEMKA